MRKNKTAFHSGLFLIAMTLLFATLIGCSGNQGKHADTGEGTDADDGRTRIVSAGKARYTLVYPDNPTATTKAAVDKLVEAVADATGVTLETKTDYLKRGAVYDSSSLEILLGRTDYGETDEALREIASNQFVIRRVGNKIVIASPKDEHLEAAVEYFIGCMTADTLLTHENGSKTLLLTEYTSPPLTDEVVRINGRELSEFSIVYTDAEAGYSDAAIRLRDVIEKAFGVRLNIYVDGYRDESDAEILVGKTNRSVSQALYAEKKVRMMTYEIAVRGTKVQLLCGGPFSAIECADYMRFAIPTLKEDGSYGKNNLAPDTAALEQGADLRIMTANILAARWGEKGTGENASSIPAVAQRAEIFAALLACYQPDVIGVQEGCVVWAKELPKYLAILKSDYGVEYTWLYSTVDGLENMTSIIYRSDKYELLEGDTQSNSYWNASKSKYYLRLNAWALLRERAASRREFIIVNTHWAHESQAWLDLSVSEEVTLVNSLRTRYQVPIFCTGDFNNKTDSAEYELFRRSAGVEDLWRQAKSVGALVNECGGCGNVGSYRKGGSYIDHIFGSGNYTTLRYETVTGNRLHWCSDHSPHISDVKFN